MHALFKKAFRVTLVMRRSAMSAWIFREAPPTAHSREFCTVCKMKNFEWSCREMYAPHSRCINPRNITLEIVFERSVPSCEKRFHETCNETPPLFVLLAAFIAPRWERTKRTLDESKEPACQSGCLFLKIDISSKMKLLFLFFHSISTSWYGELRYSISIFPADRQLLLINVWMEKKTMHIYDAQMYALFGKNMR